MNVKLLTWVAPCFSNFRGRLATEREQPAAIPRFRFLPHQPARKFGPRSAERHGVERAKIMMAEKRYDAGIRTYEGLLKSERKNAVSST